MSKLTYILKSSSFWAAILTVAFLIVGAYVPNSPITESQVGAALLPLAAFVFGDAKRPINTLLKSRRFWALVASLAFVFVKAFVPDFPLTEEQLIGLTATLGALILGSTFDEGAF
jgi:hypothetical protein